MNSVVEYYYFIIKIIVGLGQPWPEHSVEAKCSALKMNNTPMVWLPKKCGLSPLPSDLLANFYLKIEIP